MSYSERFANQWDKLVSDFRADFKGLAPEAFTGQVLNEWYKGHSFRWSSIAENEGVLLDKEGAPGLKKELTSAIQSFRFQEHELEPRPSLVPNVVIGVTGAAAVGLVMKLVLHMKAWQTILGIAIVLIATLFSCGYVLDADAKKKDGSACRQYAEELAAYKDVLVAICKKYD